MQPSRRDRNSVFTDSFDNHSSVQVDQCCFLCQRDLKQKGKFRLALEARGWQKPGYDLVAMYYDGYDITTFQNVLVPIMASWRRSDGELMLFSSGRRVLFKNAIAMESHSDCGRCFPERGVYLAHRPCWQVACAAFPAQLERLMRFAVSTRALFPRPERYPSQDLLALQRSLACIDRRTGLGRLLGAVATRLPTELQARVLAMLEATPLWHMLHTAEQALPLIAKADRYNLDVAPKVLPIRSAAGDAVRTLSAAFEELFFVDYISDLQLNASGDEPATANMRTISIRPVATRGVCFAVSKHGLRGVKVMYADGTESEWLGSTRGCWFGTAHGTDLQQLCMLKSVFTVMRIAFGASNLQSEGDKTIHAHKAIHPLWDRPLFFDRGHHHFFRPLETSPPLSSIMIPYYRNWRAFHYLPLQFAHGYASGLTFYNARTGKCGVTVHGPAPPQAAFRDGKNRLAETVSLGSKGGIATHFALANGEVFTAFYVRKSGSAGSSPVISITTSRGRKFNFGPHMYCQVRPDDNFFTQHWAGLNCPGNVSATGLFFHAAHVPDNPDTILPALPQELGVCLQSSAPTPSTPPHSSPAPPPAPPLAAFHLPAQDVALYAESSAHSVFSSTARLHDIAAIDIRKCGRRIMGVLITHHDGTRDALGQWLPPDEDVYKPQFRHHRIYTAPALTSAQPLALPSPALSTSSLPDASSSSSSSSDTTTPAEEDRSLGALDFHMRELENPVSARSNLMIISHIECRLKTPAESLVSTAFPPGHSRGTRLVKSFSCHHPDKALVWWTTFAADEVTQVDVTATQNAAPVDPKPARAVL